MSQSSIYILHGWTYSISKWAPFVSLLKKRGLTPILVNIPGLTEKINNPWNLEDYVKWLGEKLNKDKDVVLIGHSNGGRIALAFAAESPKNLSKLILIDSAGIYHNDIFIRIKRVVFMSLAKIGKKIIPFEGARILLYLLTGETDYAKADPILRKTMVNLIESDKFLVLNKVKVPTTIIWGRNDNITPLSDAKVMHRQIKNSKLYIVNSARHSPQFTHPLEVVDIILNKKILSKK